jgi:hypothetical protein
LRQFGWTVALVVVAVATRQEPSGFRRFSLQAAGGLIFAVATLWPQVCKGPYLVLSLITFPVRWIVSYLLLGVVYFGLITPLAVWFRLLSRDTLRRKLEPETTTYWAPCVPRTDAARYFRQF